MVRGSNLSHVIGQGWIEIVHDVHYYGVPMPTLANLEGLKVQMFPGDHNPPHFHLVRGEHEAVLLLKTLEVLVGDISVRDLVLARTWARQNMELLENEWNRLSR